MLMALPLLMAFLSGPLVFLNIHCAPGKCDDINREGMEAWLWTMGGTIAFLMLISLLVGIADERAAGRQRREAERQALAIANAVNNGGDGI